MSETVSPCCKSEYKHVSKNPAHVTCKCLSCGNTFSAVDAIEKQTGKDVDPEAGFHNDPRAWSK